jgi:Ran GTPase-activating protein (RanGAP) involved in mRNA processing and transport
MQDGRLLALELGCCTAGDLGNEEAQLVGEALKVDSRVTAVDLSDNCVGADGAAHLAWALRDNVTVASLDLRGNCIGSAGARALAELLLHNSALGELMIGSDNAVGESGGRALVEAQEAQIAATDRRCAVTVGF